MDFAYLYTSFDGRINRKPYWLATILLAVIMIVVIFVLGFVLAFSFLFKLLIFILQLALLYPSAALMVKRFHDRDKPGYYAAFLLGLILLKSLTDLVGITGDPFNTNMLDYIIGFATLVIAIWFLIELGFLRGTQGPNQYGPDPLGTP
jgi:uncharacterized membrane protein YhaH (DUF805 family)